MVKVVTAAFPAASLIVPSWVNASAPVEAAAVPVPLTAPRVMVTDPLQAHLDHLTKCTDADMHNVYAYLESLK